MAQKNITITYPDGDENRFRQALKQHYGQIEDPVGSGVYRDRTGPEAWDAFAASCKQSLIHLIRRVEKDNAAKAASDAVVDPNVT